MSLYIQHGHGKSDKIDTSLDDDVADGVVLAPRNEKPENLARYIESLLERDGCEVLIDPQFYVAAYSPANTRFLTEYDYFQGELAANTFTNRATRSIVKQVIDFQVDAGVTSILSPTVCFDSFSDRWYQIALNLADASLEHHAGLETGRPLLLSFVLQEEALSSEDEVNQFLDTVTQTDWGMDGFYLVISRQDGSYSQEFHPERLANLLYLVYALGSVNRLRVVVGYCDFVGLLLRSVGASAFATGWSQGLRQFAKKNFLVKKPGGQPPRERYSSGPLLNSIFLQELEDIYDVEQLEQVLSDVALDERIRNATSPQGAGWNQNLSQIHHWQTLSKLDQEIPGTNVRRNVNWMLRAIRQATGLYAMLGTEGVRFERPTGSGHLVAWDRALTAFSRRVGFSQS